MVIKLIQIDCEDPAKITLSSGEHLFGRGKLLGCDDKRISRNHGELRVLEDHIEIKALHQNPCFYTKKGSEEKEILRKDSVINLSNGDRFGLLPDAFWYEVVKCINGSQETVKEDANTEEYVEQTLNPDETINENAESQSIISNASETVLNTNNSPVKSNLSNNDTETNKVTFKRTHSIEQSDSIENNKKFKTDSVEVKDELEIGPTEVQAAPTGLQAAPTEGQIDPTIVKTEPVEVKTEPVEVKTDPTQDTSSENNDTEAAKVKQESNDAVGPSGNQANNDGAVNNNARPPRERCMYGANCYRLRILSVEVLPKGEPLETPLHPKKRRIWDPINPGLAPGVLIPNGGQPAPLPVLIPTPAPPYLVPTPAPTPEPGPSSAPTPALSPAIPSSPALFLECGSIENTPVRSLVTGPNRLHNQRPRRVLRDVEIEDLINYGSESGGSDDDEDSVPIFVPRVYQGYMETPLDEEREEAPSVPLAEERDGALKPKNLFSFDWSQFPDDPIPPNDRREPFTKVGVGPTEPSQDPYFIFTSIWDADIMKRIVKETNKYAQDVASHRMRNNTLGPQSRISNWYDTNINEMYSYFAIILAMGMVIKSKIEEYWTTDNDIFITPGFRAHMSLHRFQLLNSCLHFNNNSDMCVPELSPAEARLFKIEPILLHLNQKFQAMYTMDQNIALDESLMQWKGWLNISQFISNKAAKVGVKTYELCESQTGYLWRFDVHAKKHISRDQNNPPDASTPSIVLDLLRGLEGYGYTVWMDNFYNSPALARQLKGFGFDVVGTLRTNRQFVPQELTALTKNNMKKGDIAGYTSGDVDVLVWRDENRVALISTYHGNQTNISEGKIKPCLVLDYNIIMGGVDKKDQLLSMFPIERKRTRVWYKKFFRRLLNVSILNSFVIAKKSGSIQQHRSFRINLIQSLLSRHSTPKAIPLSTKSQVFEAKMHHLLEHPVGANKSRLRRKCCVCKNLTHFYCAGCVKTVCISSCFVSLHS